MANYTALYDANVLYPASVRDLLMNLALSDLFKARWTDEIHEEWMSNLLKNQPERRREVLERTRDLMNAHVRDCLVTGYEPLIPSLELPDPDDRHVLAAAIVGRADVIVTYNLKHFPNSALRPFGIEAQHPDDFVLHQIDLRPTVACKWIKRCRQSLKNPPKTVEEYLSKLESQQLTQTVARLREYRDFI